jgi:hypothetical protein
MSADRRAQFEADIAQVRVRTGTASSEPRWVALGGVLMLAGLAVALVAFFSSGSLADTRDVLSTVILAIFGLALVVAGAAVYLRFALSRFLRFWLLRLIYEQQDPAA